MNNKTKQLARTFFEFFLSPASLLPIVFLRVAFGVFNLMLLVNLYPDLSDLYGPTGYIQWIFVNEFFSNDSLPSIQMLYEYLPSFITVSADQFVVILFALLVGSFVAITTGFYSNLFSLLAWFLHLAFSNTGMIYAYGVESIIHMVLFYFIFMPLDTRFSVTNVLRRRTSHSPGKHIHARLFIRVLQIHICIIYLNAGLAKMSGSHWWSGEAVWRSLTQFPFSNFKPTILFKFPEVLKVAGWFVVAAETAYSVLIWKKATRRYMLSMILLMHGVIGLVMGLHFFAAIMIIINVAAFAFNLDTQQHDLPGSQKSVETHLPVEPYTS